MIRNYRAGSEVELSVFRDGEALIIQVELVRAPKLDREMRKYRDEQFEYTARDVTFFDRAGEQWGEEETGVLITEITSGGWAALGMLQVGDLLQAIDGEALYDVDSLREVMRAVAEERRPSMVMKVLRGIYTIYVELEPKWEAS